MRIAVTGAAGGVGRYVCEWLAGSHSILAIDRHAEGLPAADGVEFRCADILDAGALKEAMRGADAVLHLAGIPHPYNVAARQVLETNIIGTQHVLEAASQAGCGRVVSTSSDCVIGLVFARERRVHDYLPVDENHPARPEDSYGYSKLCTEELCRVFQRRGELEAISVRPCWVFTEAVCKGHEGLLRSTAACTRTLWAFIDPRDLAEAYRLLLEAPVLRHDLYYVAADTTLQRAPTRELLQQHFPEVSLRPYGDGTPIEGRRGLIDCTRIKAEMGWQPRYDWPAWSTAPVPA